MTSAVRFVAYCSAIEFWRLRYGTCVANAAGVASVTDDVTTTPASMPRRFAASMIVPHGASAGVHPMAKLYVLRPHEKAVAPAAESDAIEVQRRHRLGVRGALRRGRVVVVRVVLVHARERRHRGPEAVANHEDDVPRRVASVVTRRRKQAERHDEGEHDGQDERHGQ
eukprot:3192163-Prymnesium_polylepis.3